MMKKDQDLPFVVGQKAEARSFLNGFRSAWFRCKIKEISQKGEHIGAVLEYFDFPDEKVKWTRLYQIPPYASKSKDRERNLMLRPEYPPLYPRNQSPDVNEVSNVVVSVVDAWKVGDLVDWLTDGCYWSGTLTQILDNDKARIELIPPPVGEGKSYEVSFKDLRPTLAWSPEHGWAVPICQVGEEARACARLIGPLKQDSENLGMTAVSSLDSSFASDKKRSFNSGAQTLNQPMSISHAKEVKITPEISTNYTAGHSASGPSSSDRDWNSHIGGASSERRTAEEDFHQSTCSLKKFKRSGEILLNSTHSDTLEAAILDLEELASKVTWLKRILKSGVPLPLSDTVRSSWKFVEHRGPSMSK